LLVTSGVGLVSRPNAPVPYGELNEVSAAAAARVRQPGPAPKFNAVGEV